MNDEPRSVLATLRTLASGHGNPTHVRLYTVVFTLVVTAFFGLLVSGLDIALAEKKKQNESVARQRVILRLLGLTAPQEALAADATASRFAAKVREVAVQVPKQSTPYIYYRLQDPAATLVVFPIAGRGFWGPIHGYLAADEGKGVITGIAFTEHDETPGLGGRINEAWFCEQFAGKPYATAGEDGKYVRVVAKAAKGATREVDAITGATGTSTGVEALVNASIARFHQIRQQEKRP